MTHHPLAGAIAALALAPIALGPVAQGQEILVSNVGDDSVRRYSLSGEFLGHAVAPGAGGLDDPLGMNVGPDGHIYASGDLSGVVHVYDPDTGAQVRTLDTPGLIGPAGLNFRDGLLYVSDGRSGGVYRFDVATGDFVDRFITGLTVPEGVAWSVDGDEMYVGDWWTNRINAYDAQTGAFRRTVVQGAGLIRPLHMELGDQGDTILAANLFGNTITEHDIETGALVRSINLRAGGAPMARPVDWQALPDGTFIVSGSASDNILRYDADWNYLGVWAEGQGLDNPSAIVFVVPAPGVSIPAAALWFLAQRRRR